MNRDKYEQVLETICDKQSDGMGKIEPTNPRDGEKLAGLLEESAKNIRELVSVYNLENKGK